MMSSMSGYWTFTATSRPSCSLAACTWASEAAAMGCSSNSEKTASRGFPSSRSTTARTTSKGWKGTASWHCFSFSMNSGGNMSARVATAWHILIITPRIESASFRIWSAVRSWRRFMMAALAGSRPERRRPTAGAL